VRQYRSTVALHNYGGEIFFILVYNPFLQSCSIYLRLSHGVSTIVETIRYVDEQLHMLWAEVGYNWDWGGGGGGGGGCKGSNWECSKSTCVYVCVEERENIQTKL
jgi:hypothetical protein